MVDVNQFKLIIEDDEGRRSVVPVELGEVSIGRLEGNTIRLKERNVSRHHAKLMKEGPGIYAEDLDSYNGLWVNGDRVQGRHELHDGDLIRIGDFHLELRGEGLFPRREDTTQRTLLDSDTQPGYQSGSGQPDEPTLTGAKPVNPEPTQITDQQGPPGGEESFAHTAIIRPGEEAPPPDRRSPAPNVLTGQRPKLICVSTQYAGREYEIIKSETILGRTDDNDIGIDHRSVSRQHAKIIVQGRRYKIMDLESANGTMVNGEAYAQTDIKRGDLIELGHVRFRFVPPGESYTLTAEELAAVHGGGAQASGRLFLMWAAAGLVVTALVIAGWMVFNGAPKPAADGDAPPLAPVPQGAHNATDGSNAEADRIMALVRSNMQQHNWKKAQALVQVLLVSDSTNEQALSAMRQIDMEVRAQHSYDVAQGAAQQNLWSDAWNALQEVPKDSTLFAQAMTMMNTVRPALVNERLNECRSAIKSEDWDDAEMELEEVEGLDSSRKEIAELRSTIEEGRKRRPSTHPPKPHPQKVSNKPSAPKPAPPPPAPAPKPAGDDPKMLYNDGAKFLLSGQFQKAIDTLNRCVQADKNFGLCYRGLGIAYAKTGFGAKAARYYRLYLKVDPNAKDAADVQKILKQYGESQQ